MDWSILCAGQGIVQVIQRSTPACQLVCDSHAVGLLLQVLSGLLSYFDQGLRQLLLYHQEVQLHDEVGPTAYAYILYTSEGRKGQCAALPLRYRQEGQVHGSGIICPLVASIGEGVRPEK